MQSQENSGNDRASTSNSKRSSDFKHEREEDDGSRQSEAREVSLTLESVDPNTDAEELRKTMSNALARKKASQKTGENIQDFARASPPKTGHPAEHRSAGDVNSSDETVSGTTLSTDSTKTIKDIFDMTPSSIRTPSYPFPRMTLKLNRESSHRSALSHRPFTLLSPTDAPTQAAYRTPLAAGDDKPSSEIAAPAPVNPGSDPAFPTPDLTDMILMLGAEPGLDSWWANLAQILNKAFGAERASLAVPGDATDLENVPWGQKATYNVHGMDSSGPSDPQSASVSEQDIPIPARKSDRLQHELPLASKSPSKRPVLESRHSIAGARPDISHKGARQRPHGPVRAYSNISGHESETSAFSTSPKMCQHPLQAKQSFAPEGRSPDVKRGHGDSELGMWGVRAVVHRTSQALEIEPDPLMVRTSIASMFGKRKTVVLTRTHTNNTMTETGSVQSLSKDGNRSGRDADRSEGRNPVPGSYTGPGLRYLRAYDEYEQPEPSPWSQSPAPSPAARPDPLESPFFAQPASIDETAFESDPPKYDYATTANQSLVAIGADSSKSLIHTPLIQPVVSRGGFASTLRFPVAILSFLSTLNPYPSNLRHALNHLLPHLASSYLLAQQYSNLEDRLKGVLPGRHAAGFGLGGTFSDESSELELVAELSGQVAQTTGKDGRASLRSSIYSSSEKYMTATRRSSTSAPGTPFLDQFGFSSGHVVQSTPGGKSGSDMVEGYFSAKGQKSGSTAQPTTPGIRETYDDSPEKSRSSKQKQSSSKGPSKKVIISPKTPSDPPTPPAVGRSKVAGSGDFGETQQVAATDRFDPNVTHHLSVASVQSVREGSERLLPELISSLMLNSVPLQLFLAKPRSGELVWTNSKFDIFRSQGEGRVKDPWQNVHISDRDPLVKGWQQVLKTGAQFTQHIRVKRFNSDSDYRWFIFRANPLLSANGQLLYWIGSFLDVHDKHVAELRAAEEKETFVRDAKYRALANSIPQILFEAIEKEGIVSANEQWHIFSGQTLEDAQNLGFAKHVHRNDLQKCGLLAPDEVRKIQVPAASDISASSSSNSSEKTPLGRTQSDADQGQVNQSPGSTTLDSLVKQGIVTVEQDENNRVSYTTELRLRSKGGEFRWFLVRLVKVDSDVLDRSRASWYGTCTDINDRKTLERELNRVNKKIQQEMESKTKFFANMSHEIRTPLNGILGSIPWLIESSLDNDQRRTLDTIQNSSNNLRELVDNILDVTKVEAGKMNLVYKWFHLRTLLEEIMDVVSPRAIDKGLELNYTVDLNVPSMVKGDPFRLRQILINLVGNAVKFTDQGEVYTRCYLREASTEPLPDPNTVSVAFEVIDTGRGFDEAGFQRLFKQFGQIDGSSNHDAGSGLGLFLSKQLVEMHGGNMSAISEIHNGATFSFFVKLGTAAPGEDIKSPLLGRSAVKRSRTSESGSPRSRSDNRTPTVSSTKAVLDSPGSSRLAGSPDVQSPALTSASSSDPSRRSSAGGQASLSTSSSQLPTPESQTSGSLSSVKNERQMLAEQAILSTPDMKRSRSDGEEIVLSAEMKHPTTYSVVVICPAAYARAAIKQHIEQVVPHQVAVNVVTIEGIGAFRDLMHGPAAPTFTHIILDLPTSADIMVFMRSMANFTANIIPTLVVVTDHFQKKDVAEEYAALVQAGRTVYMLSKPIKTSAFALIFDPAQLRNLSKDTTRDMAQSMTETFKNVSERVKNTIGGRGFRVLLVEDSDVNRQVISRYLKKVDLEGVTAKDGLECTEEVLGRPHGYYSLIICDIQMPVKNGYEACDEIRQWERSNHYPPMPIMALTANAMPEERAAAAQAGFTDYLTKPVDFNTLGMMMMALLDLGAPHVYLRERPATS